MYMRDLLTLDAAPFAGNAHRPAGPATAAEVIIAVFALLDAARLRWCLVHGHEGLPHRHGSDIDIVVGPGVTARHLHDLLHNAEGETGARVVRARGGFITLGWTTPEGLPQFLSFDFSADYMFGNLLIRSGTALLDGRRRHGDFWRPATATEFACRLGRAILKGKLDAGTQKTLTQLFRDDQAGAKSALRPMWTRERAAELASAAETGQWNAVAVKAAKLRRDLQLRLLLRGPGRFASTWLGTQAARFARLVRPKGLNVVMLGPDGAGKSSTIAALEVALAPLFARSEVRGFAPTLKQLLRRSPSATGTPHALKPRSLPLSLLRAGWWTAYGLFSHVSLYWARVGSTLVLNDRHFVDILVDPVRYRYGGPRWLLALVWQAMPRPDLVILLHGPAEILQARKRELTVDETARQCRDYLRLVMPMRDAHVVDATQPFARVVRTVADIVVAELAARDR